MVTVTGATVITEELWIKLENATIDMLWKADKVIASKDTTVIVDGQGHEENIQQRADEIRAQIANTKSDYEPKKN